MYTRANKVQRKEWWGTPGEDSGGKVKPRRTGGKNTCGAHESDRDEMFARVEASSVWKGRRGPISRLREKEKDGTARRAERGGEA